MDNKALYEKINEQNFRLRRVLANSSAPGGVIEQTKNILLNNIDAIVESLKYAADAEKKISVLELELSDAEREIDELEKQAKAQQPKRATAKKKQAESTNE